MDQARLTHNLGAFASATSEAMAPPKQPEFAFDDAPLFTTLRKDAAQAAVDDFFSSPEWTDPSPALTSSLSFNVESCDTSPLLTDANEAPDLAGIPLFDDAALQRQLALAQQKRSSPQMAFAPSAKVDVDDAAMLLFRAFGNNMLSGGNVSPDEIVTASPAAIASPLPQTTPAPSTAKATVSRRGAKRRLDTADLLPMDAPIQPRKYKTPSATSRKDSFERSVTPATPDVGAGAGAGGDSLSAKRLSNTLAARRSRHRKAEELRVLHDTIDDLRAEVETWKQRCFAAEAERDHLRQSP